MSDEEWVALGTIEDDDTYYRAFSDTFGIDVTNRSHRRRVRTAPLVTSLPLSWHRRHDAQPTCDHRRSDAAAIRCRYSTYASNGQPRITTRRR